MSDTETTGKCLPCEQKRPTLTIGMATIDDFHGAWFTVMSLLTHHAEAMGRCEIVVVDNRPNGEHGKALQKAMTGMRNVRYVAYDGPESSCLPKSRLFDEARGEYVVCMDSHVLLEPGAIARLLAYYDQHPNTNDLLMGPILSRPGQVMATHQELVWRGGALGTWAKFAGGLTPDAEPFEIPQQGTGLFSCRKAAWPGFHPQFQGHGGNETWLMEKFRQRGGRVMCLPFLRWLHRFARPEGAPYRMQWPDRVRNYLVGFNDLGRGDLYDSAVEHLKTICPKTVAAMTALIPKADDGFNAALAEWKAAGGDAGGAIPRDLWREIRHHLQPGTRTLEFGSGLSTILFDRAGVEHTAVEHDLRWIDRLTPLLHGRAMVVRSPLKGEPPWYDAELSGPFDVILIDGPPGTIGRQGCVDAVLPLVRPGTVVFLDDLHRAPEQYIFDELQDVLGCRGAIHSAGKRKFGVLVTNQSTASVAGTSGKTE